MENEKKLFYERPETEIEELMPGTIICASNEDGGDDDI